MNSKSDIQNGITRKEFIGVTGTSILFLPFMLSSFAHSKGSVIVYTSLTPSEISDHIKVLKRDTPNVDFKFISRSSGDLSARILAEKENPYCDVIWGQGLSHILTYEKENLIKPYRPKGIENIIEEFREPKNYWAGISLYSVGFTINPIEMKKLGLEKPTSWLDLGKEQYKDRFVMPNPHSSGTGYLIVSTILQQFGEEKGWELLQKLDKNKAFYTQAGAKPASLVSGGEFPLGITYAEAVARFQRKGFPVEIYYPVEGSGYELEANALYNKANVKQGAKIFLDWAITENAMESYMKHRSIVTHKTLSKNLDVNLYHGYPVWASENKEKILERWTSLFMK